jgi:hypothetical protein
MSPGPKFRKWWVQLPRNPKRLPRNLKKIKRNLGCRGMGPPKMGKINSVAVSEIMTVIFVSKFSLFTSYLLVAV